MSLPDPQERLKCLESYYDIAVIGGGIYGATVAWEAISRGLSVVLLESRDFGSGTSANSLKTIHGGLRSLQRLDFREMREYIRERRVLLRIAPHLVAPMRCITPTYTQLSKSRVVLGAGLKLYDLIAWDRNKGLSDFRSIPPCQIISRDHLAELAPDLDCSNATGAACWYDAQAYNSERLVLAFIMAAREAGAHTYNYIKRHEYVTHQGRVCGLIAKDQFTGKEIEMSVQSVIDCTGPWAARHSQYLCRPNTMARAVNLVIRRKLSVCALGVQQIAGLNSRNRLLFIAPWRQGCIVGTWYYAETANAENLGLTDSELSDCLDQINRLFPAFGLKREDVTSIHLGLIPANDGNQSDAEPRVWNNAKIFDSETGAGPEGLIWLQGVKLTTARATAVKIVEKVSNYLNRSVRASRTHNTPLYGASFSDVREYENRCHARLSKRWSGQTINRLLRNYGSNLDAIVRFCDQDSSLERSVPGTTDTIRAELRFVLENEMAFTLTDLVLRRTDIGSFACPAPESIEYCADVMAEFCGWDHLQRRENIDELLHSYPVWCRD